MSDNSDFMTEAEMAGLVSLSPGRLKQLRYERRVYPFHKIAGTRAVFYKRSEIMAILDAGRVEVRS